MKRKNILKTIILIILTIIVIVFLKRTTVIKYINKQLSKKQITSKENNITMIDVTGVAPGKEAEHEHIYKTMYDNSEHWEECIVCGEKRNKKVHSLTTTWALGYESCESNNHYTNACTCGYSETGHKPCVWDNNSYMQFDFFHCRKCTVCNSAITHSYYLYYFGNGNTYESTIKNHPTETGASYQWCYKSNGSRLTCNNLGICCICGKSYTEPQHLFRNVTQNFEKVTNDIKCYICNTNFGKVYNQVAVEKSSAEYTIISNVSLPEGATCKQALASGMGDDCFEINTVECMNINDSGNIFTLKNKFKFKNNIKTDHGLCIQYIINFGGKDFWMEIYLDESSNGSYYIFYPDKIEPTISNISIGDNNLWSKSKSIVISGTESYCNIVNVKIIDDKEKIIYKGTGNIDWSSWTENTPYGKYSISCTPELEAGLEGRTFKAIVTDSCNNSTEQEFTISKIDGVAPEVTSIDKVDNEWAKEKDIVFTATDQGIGNVQIAFNDVNDYRSANKNGTEYSREYKLTGDVYSPRKAKVFYKDELNNITSQEIAIDKIDNTKPTITGASFSNNKLNITAHDRHQTEGEGSGIVKYRFITATDKLKNPDITTENSTQVAVNENIIIPEINKVKYVYIIAEDKVGNISEVYDVKVPQLELISKVNLSGVNGKGVVELDWSGYDIQNKYFVVYRKQEGEEEWKTIVGLEEKFNGNKYVDNLANDKTNASVPNINVVSNQETNSIEITRSSERWWNEI